MDLNESIADTLQCSINIAAMVHTQSLPTELYNKYKFRVHSKAFDELHSGMSWELNRLIINWYDNKID